ncbi:hypothetical protein JX266_009514 [Neoarthrinium moseri]|nr:hypothetical protein JX266_009514 [Neoarthrinium moseri]
MYSLTCFTIAAILSAAGVSARHSTSECAKGLKMFVSRGTNEPMGAGETGKVVKVISEQIDGSDYEAIRYPASFENPNYFLSVGNGTRLLKETITEYARACPDSKMAVFGYSQGAQITSNNFCGQPPIWSPYSGIDVTDIHGLVEFAKPLPKEVTKNVVAVVLFGDTTHRKDASYNRGNSTGSGIYWRADISACEGLGNRIRSYCDAGDPFCDVNMEPKGNPHLEYVYHYGNEVVEYVIEQYKSGSSNSSGTNVGSPSSPTHAPIQISGANGILSVPVSAIAIVLLVSSMM